MEYVMCWKVRHAGGKIELARGRDWGFGWGEG